MLRPAGKKLCGIRSVFVTITP